MAAVVRRSGPSHQCLLEIEQSCIWIICPVRSSVRPTLWSLLRHRARCQPDDIAFTYLVDGENEQVHLTYRELDRQARAIGAWLESHGSGRASGRCCCIRPGLEFIAAFFGCLYAGVVAVPVYPPRRNRSLKRIQALPTTPRPRWR